MFVFVVFFSIVICFVHTFCLDCCVSVYFVIVKYKILTFNNIKPLLSNNSKPSMRMIYHYYNVCKLLSSNDLLLLDLVI